MKREPTDRELRPIGRVRFKKARYKDEWVVRAYWTDPPQIRKPNTDGRRNQTFRNVPSAQKCAVDKTKEIEAAEGKSTFAFDDAAKGWLKQQQDRALAKNPTLTMHTLRRRRQFLEIASAQFGPRPLHEIKSRHIEAWRDALAREYSNTTIPNFLWVMRSVLEHAQRHEMLAVNPMLVHPVRVQGRRRKRAPDIARSDIEALRDFFEGPKPDFFNHMLWSSMGAAFVLGASCGLRRGEICGLRWDHIDPDNPVINIVEVITDWPYVAIKQEPKTPAGFRKVYMTRRARELLDAHAVRYRKAFGSLGSGHVIRTSRSDSKREFTRPGLLSRSFAQAMVRAGVVDEHGKPKWGLHGLRHWYSTYMTAHAAEIGGIQTVARLIGHEHASTTLDIYGHAIDDPHLREKIEAMQDWLVPAGRIDGPIRPALPRPQPDQIDAGSLVALRPLETPIAVPEHAERWLRVFLRELWQHGRVGDALHVIHKTREQVRYELKRLGLPTIDELRGMALMAPAEAQEPEGLPEPVEEPCPIDVPDMAPAWLRPYIRHRDQGMHHEAACRMIRKSSDLVSDELQRWKLPAPKELGRRLRDREVRKLLAQRYPDRQIATMLDIGVDVVKRVRTEMLHIPNTANILEHKGKLVRTPRLDTRPQHKRQLKLL